MLLVNVTIQFEFCIELTQTVFRPLLTEAPENEHTIVIVAARLQLQTFIFVLTCSPFSTPHDTCPSDFGGLLWF